MYYSPYSQNTNFAYQPPRQPPATTRTPPLLRFTYNNAPFYQPITVSPIHKIASPSKNLTSFRPDYCCAQSSKRTIENSTEPSSRAITEISLPTSNHSYRQYFENPDLRKINVYSSPLRVLKAKNSTDSSTNRDYSETDSRCLNRVEFTLKPKSIQWNHINTLKKPALDLSRRLFNTCRVKHSKSCFCEDQAPCKWALKWTRWSKQPSSNSYFSISGQKISAATREQIRKDLNRTQPNHPEFRAAMPILEEVLSSYSKYDKQVDYVQGINVIASVLIYHIKDAQGAFWVLVDLMELKDFREIYLNNFSQLKSHTKVFTKLVKYYIHDLHQHFAKIEVQLDLVCLGWFLSLLCNTIPLQSAHLAIDAFLTQGWLGFYKICLAHLVYLKEELFYAQEATEVMVRLSSVHPQEDTDWPAILEAAKNIDLDASQIYRIP